MRRLPIGMRTLLASQIVIGVILGVLAITVFYLAPILHLILRYEISVEFLTTPLAVGIQFAAFGYGTLRAGLYHPVFDKDYLNWLASTPWTPNHPLPKGPLHLVWADLIVVGVLTAIAYFVALTMPPPISLYVVGPTVLFALAIAIVWTLANNIVGQKAHVHAVLWVPVLFAALPLPPQVMVCCPFVMAGIAWRGMRRSLVRFPWSGYDGVSINQRPSSLVGWPFSTLLHPPTEYRTTLGKALMGAALWAGWIWLLLRIMAESDPEDDLAVMMTFVAFGSMIAAGVRLVRYAPVICSHLCWGHRAANRQWIIPQHDRVFVAPLLTVVVGVTVPWILYYRLGASIAVSCGLAAGLAYLITRSMGPSIGELHLTGVHSKFGELPQSREFITTSGSKS